MYKQILLAYDGSVEGRTALREGAMLAKTCGAKVFLLSVIAETPGTRVGDSAYPGVLDHEHDAYRSILQEGLARLADLGLKAEAELAVGEPAQMIGGYARRVKADLVVVGHRKQSLLARWWAGPTSAYLVDHVDCSVLIARSIVSDECFKSVAADPALAD